MDDRNARGRVPSGEDNGRARLTAAEVAAIRSEEACFTQRQLAARYGVCRATIWNAIHRKTWTKAA